MSDILFWNVDTQVDFIEPEGRLYVPGAELLKPTWAGLTQTAKDLGIQVVNTADYHYINSQEIDKDPDMVKTFPEHCMVGTEGAEFIKETDPEDPTIFEWDHEYLISNEIANPGKHRNIVIRKDAFDVFSGNPHTVKILKIIHPETIVVYGVTTNICVDFAVMNLSKIGNVWVVEDAIKELPGIPLPFEKWGKRGVKLLTFDVLCKQLSGKVHLS
ncbi:hypothetical protein MNBD_BACTEROID01-1759 [hydrothermal vent metagenome]|uniref:nicotinamidase n=1 Tax=hydrothermal vent metagenome TaxID=652676 RepID=A0A3B0TCG0_9ZZZZ